MSQSIFRSTHVRDYTVFNNKLIAEPSLSFRAKGVLLYLLSKPQDWKTRVKDIQRHGKEGRDAIRGAIAELTEAGYIIREQVRDESGAFAGTEYLVFESPQTENPKTGNPKTENPTPENPTPENPTLQSNDQQSIELTKEKDHKVTTTTQPCKSKGSGGDDSFLGKADENKEQAKHIASKAVELCRRQNLHVTLTQPLINACEGKSIDAAVLNAIAVKEKSEQVKIRQPQGMLTKALQENWAPSSAGFVMLNEHGKKCYLREFIRACHVLGLVERYRFDDDSYTILRDGQQMTCDYQGIPSVCGEGSLSTLWEEIKWQEAA